MENFLDEFDEPPMSYEEFAKCFFNLTNKQAKFHKRLWDNYNCGHKIVLISYKREKDCLIDIIKVKVKQDTFNVEHIKLCFIAINRMLNSNLN